GALIIQGIQPGPRMVEAQPDLFWGLIASMWIGNVMLLVINLPMIGMWVKLLQVPYKFLYPSILVFCAIGAYSTNNNVFDVYTTVVFAVIGYMFNKLKMEPAPLLIGFVLGPMMEEHLRRAMLLSRGDPMVFIQRPISASMLAIAAVALLAMTLPNLRKGKEAAMAG
ncbi:MAG: tripartite tricarboxylate transporter permease, partial [Acetobacteraceae bacterium]|nr:tripartite tricarboxylate transporter permease [Acetobacteraceae bacterium]